MAIFKHNKTILLSLLLCTNLLAENNPSAAFSKAAEKEQELKQKAQAYDGVMQLDEASDKEKKLFMQRYNENNLKRFKKEDYIKPYNLDKHADSLINLEKIYERKEQIAEEYKLKEKTARPENFQNILNQTREKVYSNTFSEKGKERINEAKRHIIYGDFFNNADGKQYFDNLLASIFEQNDKAYNSLPHSEILSRNQALYIVVSSALDDELIINYFKALKRYNKEAQFILRGVVNNDITYLRPTIEYFERLRKKANIKEAFNININPKITQLFKIEEAPAVVFLDNYDGELDLHDGNTQLKDKTKAYVLLGDIELTAALKEINKEAKSDNLNKLIDAIEKDTYFNRTGGEQ